MLLSRILKAEKLQRVFANMSVNLQTDRGADFRQSIKNIQGDKYLIADPAHVDHRFAGDLLRQGSADMSDHVKSKTPSRRALKLAQRLTASSRQSRQLVFLSRPFNDGMTVG